MTEIELTDEQRRAIAGETGKPVGVVNPDTQQRYVLIAHEQYERVRSYLEQRGAAESLAPPVPIPSGILQSQQAFWRDLPELLREKRLHRKWIAYHGIERVGIAGTERELIRECLRRGYHDDEYFTAIIVPRQQPPWEPEEIEAGGHEASVAPGSSNGGAQP
jgi:hypothetical protein